MFFSIAYHFDDIFTTVSWSSKCMGFAAVTQMHEVQVVLLFYHFMVITAAIKVINNGLAPPEIVHSPVRTKRSFLLFFRLNYDL